MVGIEEFIEAGTQEEAAEKAADRRQQLINELRQAGFAAILQGSCAPIPVDDEAVEASRGQTIMHKVPEDPEIFQFPSGLPVEFPAFLPPFR